MKPWKLLGLSEKAWLIRRVAITSTVLEISDASILSFIHDHKRLEQLARTLKKKQLRKDVQTVEQKIRILNPCT